MVPMGFNIPNEVEFQIFVEDRIDRPGSADQEQRVTVCRCTDGHFRSQIGGGTRSVFHHEGLSKTLREALPDKMGQDVSHPARRKTYEQAYWPGRIGLRPCGAGYDGNPCCSGRDCYEPASCQSHGGSSVSSRSVVESEFDGTLEAGHIPE